MTITKMTFKSLLASAFLACAFVQPALAAEISGVKFDETVKQAGKEIKLNGVGMRTRFFIKVYATGMYLPEKASTAEEVLKMEGPRRMTLVMMRDVSSDEFGSAFITGLNDNSDAPQKAKIIAQISKFGEMFAMLESIKKGDELQLNWMPGVGTTSLLNGKKIGEVLPDIAFYNAVTRIWLGDKPVDKSLKVALLGGKK
ncbi:MAG: chalcone isomerase family protein [Pseudomonadota bacterium]